MPAVTWDSDAHHRRYCGYVVFSPSTLLPSSTTTHPRNTAPPAAPHLHPPHHPLPIPAWRYAGRAWMCYYRGRLWRGAGGLHATEPLCNQALTFGPQGIECNGH